MTDDSQRQLSDTLGKIVDDLLAEEGITPALLDMVDLSVAYSPVLLAGGQFGRDDVELIPYGFLANENDLPEKFTAADGMPQVYDRDQVTIMRARWLLAREAYHKPQMDAWRESMKRPGQYHS